jgi:hypothetical protein
MSGFESFEKKYGAPVQPRVLEAAELAECEKVLPANLVDYFRRSGVGQYGKGLFRTVSPVEAASLVDGWGDLQAARSTFLITAFGCFVYRDGSSNRLVNVWAGTRSELFSDAADAFEGNLCDADFIKSVLLKSDFLSASKRLGPPGQDECFGFVPAIALGGDGSAASIQRVKLREHLALLAQLSE